MAANVVIGLAAAAEQFRLSYSLPPVYTLLSYILLSSLTRPPREQDVIGTLRSDGFASPLIFTAYIRNSMTESLP